MAVVLDGWGVVARRTVVEARLPNGLAGWFEISTRMACADRDLCFAAFMVHEDAVAFAAHLDSLGVQEAAVVGREGPWKDCAWIRVGPYAGVTAAWMADADPEPLVVPMVWRPNSIFNLTAEEASKRLKFVRREGDVEVFVDTVTGEELYRGRRGPSHDMEPAAEQQFQAAIESIKDLLNFGGPPKRVGFFSRRRLAKGIRELEAIATDDRWRVLFFLGIARRAAGDDAAALDALERAFAANPDHADVARELGLQYLALGRGDRAVTVCERGCRAQPDDAGLRANLALACMVAGDMERAKAEVNRALEMAPNDAITRGLAIMIDAVIAGRRTRPTKYP